MQGKYRLHELGPDTLGSRGTHLGVQWIVMISNKETLNVCLDMLQA